MANKDKAKQKPQSFQESQKRQGAQRGEEHGWSSANKQPGKKPGYGKEEHKRK